MRSNEKPHLEVTKWVKGEPIYHRCSRCGQLFILTNDGDPKEAAAELLAAFREHVRDEHAEEAKD